MQVPVLCHRQGKVPILIVLQLQLAILFPFKVVDQDVTARVICCLQRNFDAQDGD